MSRTYTTQTLADALGGDLTGDGQIVITRLAHPADVRGAGDLALALDAKLLPLLENTASRAAIISRDTKLTPGLVAATIAVDRPRLALAKLTSLFAAPVPVLTGIHPTAVIEAGAHLGRECYGRRAGFHWGWCRHW